MCVFAIPVRAAQRPVMISRAGDMSCGCGHQSNRVQGPVRECVRQRGGNVCANAQWGVHVKIKAPMADLQDVFAQYPRPAVKFLR